MGISPYKHAKSHKSGYSCGGGGWRGGPFWGGGVLNMDVGSSHRSMYHLPCALHVCLFYCTQVVLRRITIVIEAHYKDIETEVYKHLPLLSPQAQMELLGVHRLHTRSPCQSRRPVGVVRRQPCSLVRPDPLGGPFPGLGRRARLRLHTAPACLPASFPASRCLLPGLLPRNS